MESKTTPATCEEHQPEDYADFERMATNIRSWNWPDDPDMMIGECRLCSSSISYPKGPSEVASPPACFGPPTGLKDETVAELLRIQSRSVERMTDAHTDGAITIDEVGS